MPNPMSAREAAYTIREALGLLSSMVASGESHTPTTTGKSADAHAALDVLVAAAERADTAERERDEAIRLIPVVGWIDWQRRAEAAEARADTLEAALQGHGEAWSNEADCWRREVLPWFQSQPDEMRHDAKELIAAIESRAVVCSENARAALAEVEEWESRHVTLVAERDSKQQSLDLWYAKYKEQHERAEIAEADARVLREIVRSDGHGTPSFHMSGCPGCAALAAAGGAADSKEGT